MFTGIIEEMRVDEDYLKEWEEEVKSGAEEKEGKGHGNGDGNHESGEEEDHSEEHEDLDIEAELEQIARMRQRVEDSEKGYLSFYSILAVEYEVYKID